jgi:hypothetical protein
MLHEEPEWSCFFSTTASWTCIWIELLVSLRSRESVATQSAIVCALSNLMLQQEWQMMVLRMNLVSDVGDVDGVLDVSGFTGLFRGRG